MSRPPCPRPIAGGRSLDIEMIDHIADHLLAVRRLDPPAGAQLVRIRPARGGIDIGQLPLPEGVHPADILLGHIVPRGWSVAGVVASGTAHRLDDGTSTRVGVAVLVDRQGRCVHRLDGDEPLPDTTGEPLEGRVVDLLRRALDLPTPSPAVPPRQWWDALWLDAVVAAVAADPSRHHRFDDLARVHPLISPDGSVRTIEDAGRVAACNEVDGWSVIRRAAANPVPETVTDSLIRRAVGPFVSSDIAAWMDDGCLARWLTDALPPTDVLLATAGDLLPPSLARRLRRAIA